MARGVKTGSDTAAKDRKAIATLLQANQTRRSNAETERNAANRELRELVVRGYSAGVDVAGMARTAQISRDTAHRILKEAGVMPWRHKQDWVGKVLEYIPRGTFEQNMYRSLVNMTLLRALGAKGEDTPHSLKGVLDDATATMRVTGYPNFEPKFRDKAALFALPWPA